MRTDSPEDKLLHLIKGKYRKKPEEEASSSPGGKDTFLTEASKKIFLKNKALRPLFSDSVNRTLAIILILLSGYLGYSLLFPSFRNIKHFVESAAIPEETPGLSGKDASPRPARTENYSVYAKAMQGKKLFSAAFDEEGKEGPKEPDIDVSKRFNLVGIIAGDNPQAIIEDTETKKTHYLSKGQVIESVTVKEVTEGRVILEYKGREVMLVL